MNIDEYRLGGRKYIDRILKAFEKELADEIPMTPRPNELLNGEKGLKSELTG